MYTLNDKHMETVLQLRGPERYEYFVKRAADWGTIYGLQSSSGWALAGDEIGPRILPVWPHERFAELCKKGDWSDCKAVKISLAEWFDDLSKTLDRKDMKVAVFPLPEGRGVVVDPGRLSSDLRDELSKIEDDE